MHRSFVASVLALTLFATGCSATAESTGVAAQDVTGAETVVQVVETLSGPVLANTAGLSLYTFDNDTTSESTCYNGCAVRWPAALVTADVEVAAPFGTTTRTDGSIQLTLDGDPLYTYFGDAAPGDTTGDGLGGVWHLARPVAPPVVVVVEP